MLWKYLERPTMATFRPSEIRLIGLLTTEYYVSVQDTISWRDKRKYKLAYIHIYTYYRMYEPENAIGLPSYDITQGNTSKSAVATAPCNFSRVATKQTILRARFMLGPRVNCNAGARTWRK